MWETAHVVDIPYKYGQTFNLKPFFDFHGGDDTCDTRAAKKYLQDSDENSLLLLGGDNIGAIIPGDPRYQKGVEHAKGDAVIDEQVDETATLIRENYNGKVIGVMIGNHEMTCIKRYGTHPGRHLAEKLDSISLGFSCMIRLRFSENGSRGRSVIIYAHHGFGGSAQTEGANLTKYWRFSKNWEADLFLYGHVHELKFDKSDKMVLSGNKIISKPKRLYICGSFQKTFLDGDIPTWAETKGFRPISVGAWNIMMKPNGTWVDIEQSC